MVAFMVASLVLLRARAGASRAGAWLAGAVRAAGVLHQGRGGVLRRRARARRAVSRGCTLTGSRGRRRPRGTRARITGRSSGWSSAAALALALFVLPHWTDYRFYNWQMSVTRKPSYDLQVADRPRHVVPDPARHLHAHVVRVLASASPARSGCCARWRSATPPERLLALWIGVGTFELMLHDVGNERRFLIFIPALVALAALALGRDRALLPAELATSARGACAIGAAGRALRAVRRHRPARPPAAPLRGRPERPSRGGLAALVTA